jgi:hypothetical protein
MSPEERRNAELSPERRDQFYQRDYYLQNRVPRARAHKARWWSDPEYRKREIERAQNRRAIKRAETAPERFEKMVEAVAGDAEKPHRPPVLVEIGSKEVAVLTTAALAIRCGRKVSTVRTWIEEGVLPGVSAVIGGRAKFTDRFMDAVKEACRRILFLDGRGDHDQLRLLIVEELASRRESYVPVGKRIEKGHERPSLVAVGERNWPGRA